MQAIVGHQPNYTPQFQFAEAAAFCDTNLFKPYLGSSPVSIDMDMRRLVTIGREKVQAKSGFLQNSRHA
jgi:hypothetical protein